MVKKKIKVHIIDMSGFGYSGGQRLNMPMHVHISDMMTVIKKIKDSDRDLPIFVYGHFLGGLVALNFLTVNKYVFITFCF